MLDQLLAQLPIGGAETEAPQDITGLVAMGEEVLNAGEVDRAISIFAQIVEMAPDDPAAVAGHARALLQAGRADEAEAALAALPEAKAQAPEVVRAKAALALAKEARPVDDLVALAAEVEKNPDDQDARYRLAGGLMAAGDRDGAADALLEGIRRDREWNEGAARTRLLTLFEAVGLEDPWVSAQRRRLSAILFT
jgi:putative thioredoxin